MLNLTPIATRNPPPHSETPVKPRCYLSLVVITTLMLASSDAAQPLPPQIDTVQLLADQGWSNDPRVIWYDSFDSDQALSERYLEVGDDDGDFKTVAIESLGRSGKSLRAKFQIGEVSAGGIKKLFGRNPMDYRGRRARPKEDFNSVYWRHYIKHQVGWRGNPAKLSRATCFAGKNWSQAMIAHIWGGRSLNLTIDPARGIDASSQVATRKYNDFPKLKWLGFRQGKTELFDTANCGRWVCVEGHAQLNTPGKSDGLFTLWIDGQVEVRRDDLDWVGSYREYGINAVFLENYWNDGSIAEQERFFDDFVISTAPIGLARSPLNPIVWKTAFVGGDAGERQSGWQLQLALDQDGRQVVWTSGTIDGQGDSVTIDARAGRFAGQLAGNERLAPDQLYFLRARQRNTSGKWSLWSQWASVLRTGDDGSAGPAE